MNRESRKSCIPRQYREAVADMLMAVTKDYLAGARKSKYYNKVLGKLGESFGHYNTNEIIFIIRRSPNETEMMRILKEYVGKLSKITIRDPAYLKQLIGAGLTTNARFSNRFLMKIISEREDNLIKMLEGGLRNILGTCLYHTSQRLAPEGYILGVESGEIIKKRMKGLKNGLEEVAGEWWKLATHAPLFMALDGNGLNKIVQDYEEWSLCNSLMSLPEMGEGEMIGKQLVRFGLDHKVYASDKPHKIIFKNQNLDSVTVVDCFENGILFKPKFPDNKISVGCSLELGDEIVFLDSHPEAGSAVFGFRPSNLKQLGALYALTGAIMRDMFVCEEKKRFYIEKIRQAAPTRENLRPASRIIWLPRQKVEYLGLPEKVKGNLKRFMHAVASAEVPGHARKCKNPNPEQVKLAKQYKVHIPRGKTFVRPHRRLGYRRGSRSYKSRSALELLFAR